MVGEETVGGCLEDGWLAEVLGVEEEEAEFIGFEAFGAVDAGEDGGFGKHLGGEGVVGAALPGSLRVIGFDSESVGVVRSRSEGGSEGVTDLSRSST